MALLQISEPGLSAAPHQRRLAVGIDLGTTNSLVATVRSGQAETLADEQGRHPWATTSSRVTRSGLMPAPTPRAIRPTPSARLSA